ncbi:MAG TPA: DUF3987 domain-containing protein [Bacteroidetes bacterium]|nr:DUF3987 domain-containing protein [Bacteroidota bacterium]HIL57173.1 DUF3987 domain-containing protein [Rhodothermales bacterium]
MSVSAYPSDAEAPVAINGAAREREHDPAFLRVFCGVPAGVSDAEVIEGAEAVREMHAARERYEASVLRAKLLTSGWRDAVPDAEASFVPFPTDVLPHAAANLVRGQAAALDVDEAAVAVPVVVALAAAVGNVFAAAPKRTWHERPAVWAVLVMPSGAKKSGAVEAAVSPTLRFEADARAEHEAEAEAYAADLAQWEELTKAQQKSTPKPIPPPARRRFRVGDTTVESVASVHAENARGLLLYRDELSAWVGSFDRYSRGDADLANWIEMCGGRSAVIDRKSNRDRPTIHVPFPNVSVIGTIQPRTLRQKLGPPHFDSGFAARLLFVEPPSRPRRWTDADVTPEVLSAYDALIRRVYSVGMGEAPAPIDLTPEAKALFISFVNENGRLIDRTPEGPIRASLSKIEAYAVRFALAFHIADVAADRVPTEPGPLPANALARGIFLARWFRREQARVYIRHGFAEVSLDRDERLARKLPEAFTWQDVKEVWEVGKSGAYNVIERLLSKGFAEDEAHGRYRRTVGGMDTPGGLVDFLDFGPETT